MWTGFSLQLGELVKQTSSSSHIKQEQFKNNKGIVTNGKSKKYRHCNDKKEDKTIICSRHNIGG
jgi:hypothetical protein